MQMEEGRTNTCLLTQHWLTDVLVRPLLFKRASHVHLQAGVAMGLARLAGTRFPDWGPQFQTFMVRYSL